VTAILFAKGCKIARTPKKIIGHLGDPEFLNLIVTVFVPMVLDLLAI